MLIFYFIQLCSWQAKVQDENNIRVYANAKKSILMRADIICSTLNDVKELNDWLALMCVMCTVVVVTIFCFTAGKQ